jgi:hypothetical protein
MPMRKNTQRGAKEIHFNHVNPEGPSGEIFPSISEHIHSSSKFNQGNPYGGKNPPFGKYLGAVTADLLFSCV